MKRLVMLDLVLALLAACAPASREEPPAKPKPDNVVVIVVDDIGVDLIGAYDAYFRSIGRAPGTPASTPAIDQLLAAQGVLFVNAWSCPTCSPSRGQMLTGRHGFRTGIGTNIKDLEKVPSSNPGLASSATLTPQLMRALGGYTSAAVGKWHIADMDQITLDLRHPLGSPAGTWFDRYAGSLFNLSKPNGSTAPPSYFNWRKAYASELVPGVNPCGDARPPCEVAITGTDAASYATVDTADDALQLVATLPEPWFLHVAFNASHDPIDHAIPADLPRASCGEYEPSTGPCTGGTPPLDKRCVTAALDAQIGRILCALDLRDTTVILVGDNGTDEAAILPPFDAERSKGSLYEGGVNVPFIVCSPLIDASRAGSVSTALVSTVDLFATLAEIAAGAPGASRAEDSVSLVPLLRGRVAAVRETLYSESFLPNFRPDAQTGAPPEGYVCTRHFQALRTERFKLIRRWGLDDQTPKRPVYVDELFDLTQGGPPDTSVDPPRPTPDPYERNSLLHGELPAGSPAERALAALRLELETRYPTLVR